MTRSELNRKLAHHCVANNSFFMKSQHKNLSNRPQVDLPISLLYFLLHRWVLVDETLPVFTIQRKRYNIHSGYHFEPQSLKNFQMSRSYVLPEITWSDTKAQSSFTLLFSYGALLPPLSLSDCEWRFVRLCKKDILTLYFPNVNTVTWCAIDLGFYSV